MPSAPTILMAEDDDGHAILIEENLKKGGVVTPILRFTDGQEVLDFLEGKLNSPKFDNKESYLLLLDIRMPKVDGVEVLKQIKENPKLRKLTVIMLTTTDDPREIQRCHALGCNNYIQKPGSFEKFSTAIKTLGRFLSLLQLPSLAHS